MDVQWTPRTEEYVPDLRCSMNTKLPAYKLHKKLILQSFPFSTAIAGMTERTFFKDTRYVIVMSVLSHAFFAIKNS